MKKIVSIALALMMIVSLFAMTSCGKAPAEMLDAASEALSEKPYTMTMQMNVETDNAEVQEYLNMMNTEIPVIIDGSNMSVDMTSSAMGQAASMKMILVDKVLYYNMELGDRVVKMKANLNDEQMADFTDENSADMPVEYNMFTEFTAETKNGKTVITCSGLNEEGKKALNDELASAINQLGEATLSDLSYTVALKDGKFDTMNLSCTYTVAVNGVSVTVTLNLNATFSYDNVPAIVAPADAADYREVDYGDLMGA